MFALVTVAVRTGSAQYVAATVQRIQEPLLAGNDMFSAHAIGDGDHLFFHDTNIDSDIINTAHLSKESGMGYRDVSNPLKMWIQIPSQGVKMVAIPKDILDLMTDKATVKTLVTASASGQPHAIVCGSIGPLPDGKVIVGEVLMKRAKANLAANGKAAMLITAGPKSFELVLANPARADSGPVFEKMKEVLASMKLPCFAVWTFDVCEIWDEGAGPNAGTQIA